MGLVGDLASSGGVCPPWAAALGWDQEGIWVLISLKELEQAAPPLKIFAPTSQHARLLIKAAPPTNNLYPTFFRQLEDAGLPVVAFDPNLMLVCDGGVLTRSPEGHTHLSAEMYLEHTLENKQESLRFRLPRRMHLTSAPGSATSGGGPELVSPFKVHARVTADSLAVFARTEPHGLEEADLEADLPVFLNSSIDDQESVASGITRRPHTTTPPKPRRSSWNKRILGVISRTVSHPLQLAPPPVGRVAGGGGGGAPAAAGGVSVRAAAPVRATGTAVGTAGAAGRGSSTLPNA